MDEKTVAIEKLENEFAKCDLSDNHIENVIGKSIKDRLVAFCKESVLFSRKVLRSVPTVIDCIKSIAEPIKQEHIKGISDFEVYAKAVKFYSEASNIKFLIEITCSEESVEVTREEYDDILAKQNEIAENIAKEKAEKAAAEAQKKAKAEIERKERLANANKKKEQTTQQLSLFDM